ncbi:cupin domain-containing protein [Kistimonas asteriae]|uniref:cupin domain-containing protein n=1 Tax=Kistimonas asteriae TaxID=517724 RepID=UPI001BAB0DAB|nr:cupin domain-containing protein [Kistimonas asteriae]
MNIDEIEKDWISRGFSFGVGTIKSGDGVNEAVHNDKDELVIMEKGKYEFTLDDESFVQEGCAEVYIPAGSTHSIKNLGPTDSKIYYGYKSTNL